MSTDTILPHDSDAEMALLGSLLLDGHFPIAERQWPQLAWLKGRMFFSERHALVFEAIAGVLAAGGAPDVVTVAHELDKRGTWDAVGGGGYLFLLTNRVPTPLHAEHYAQIVRECWQRRELIRKGTTMVEQGLNGRARRQSIDL